MTNNIVFDVSFRNTSIDNSNIEGAPVIMDSNYSYHNIFGSLEYENYYGSLKTDHTMLKPGLLQQANGGYIIFRYLRQKFHFESTNPRWIGKRLYELPSSQYSIG